MVTSATNHYAITLHDILTALCILQVAGCHQLQHPFILELLKKLTEGSYPMLEVSVQVQSVLCNSTLNTVSIVYNCVNSLQVLGQNIRGSAISSQFVLFSWLLLALQVKVGKVASFVGKIFVVQCSTTKTTNILPHENYPLYGNVQCRKVDYTTLVERSYSFPRIV